MVNSNRKIERSLNEIDAALWYLRHECEYTAKSIALDCQMHDGKAAMDAINMVFNHATMALELVSHYRHAWQAERKTKSSEDIEVDEKIQRLTQIGSNLFVSSVSSVEFSAKRFLNSQPTDTLAMRPGKRVYLRDVIEASTSAGFISDSDRRKWGALLDLRNCIVHNNAISDVERDIRLRAGLRIQLQPGQMTKGNPAFFPQITGSTVTLFGRWGASVLRRTKWFNLVV